MKHLKKIMSLLLTAIMVIAMCVPVMAAEGATTYSLTIKGDKEGHTYTAYQIFSVKLNIENGEKILSDIEWGSGVSEAAKAALGDAKTFAGTLNDRNIKTIAKRIAETSGYLATPAGTVSASTKSGNEYLYVISNLAPGYYLVKDQLPDNEQVDDAMSDYIVRIVGNVEVAAKVAKPTVDKQVLDETGDAETESTDGWGESADHAINESFQFKLKATLPANKNYASYTSYMVKFNDTMSDGITFESIESVKIICGGKEYSISEGSDKTTEPSKYFTNAVANTTGLKWSLEIPDIKRVSQDIYLTNGATIEVIYNAHLNENAILSGVGASAIKTNNNKVDLEYSNNPNGTGTGKTKEDHVWVFTYKVDNTKVNGSVTNGDGSHPALSGAKFKLYSTSEKEIGLIYDTEKKSYRPIKDGETATEMVSANDGKFNIIGLDAGTYVLREEEAPSGFNKCDDITIVISAQHTENMTTGADLDLTNSKNTVNTIEDKKGSTLPETGGIGTTIFYVVGVVLMLGAGVLLITKRRMSAKH